MNKWVALVVLVLFAGVALAQEGLPPGGKEFKDGEAAYKKQNWATAITNFESAVSQNDKLFLSYYYLGWAYRHEKDFSKSGDNFVKFLEKVPDDPKTAEVKGQAIRFGALSLAQAKEYQKAIPWLQKAASAKPNDVEVIWYLGMSEMLTDNEAKAVEHFAKVNQLQPNLDRAWYFGGRIAYNAEDMGNAKTRLEKYLELKPDGDFAPDAHFMLGSMAMRGGSKAVARSHLQKFLQLKPNAPQAPQAHYILGSLAAQAEQLETARRHFQRYLQLEPRGPQAEEIRKFLADLK
jgi:tetratricopeptide (TPR) repeat protein